ncbi:MAG: tetratricopeptide repeat protein [Candidatus Abyssobacteria bacterium SURF_17]|uniref:Tetratricopeptide repeat protein n=1 Tax=Candidatus Abyssobacteria bacterium SURF_17 TaxID=2093361 RepID=A0A419EX30_9BACT|nr:MAG: tetratricopeptide repeat protein [Candidatus Abyssubacteria bacterium SURF_17]
MRLWKKLLVGAACIALAAFAGMLSRKVEPALATTAGFGGEELHHASHSMPMTLLGQFRTNLDAYLWLKTIDYLHNGIAYRPYTTVERTKGMREHEHDIGGFAKHPCGGPTLIPPKEKDWRGVFGELERNLQPYRPGPARHSDPQELIPWYRIQTMINPLDVNAYATCAFFLTDFAKEPEKALAFLEEGIEKNPHSPVLHQAIGQLYFDKWKRYDQAIPCFQKAIAAGKEIQVRDEAQEKAFGDAYLFLARAYRERGELDAALRTAKEGMAECATNNLIRVIYRVIKKEIDENSPSNTTEPNGQQ